MLKKWILLLVIILVASLILPVGATQYNPPWTHNYGFLYTDFDSRSQATNATNYQSIVGYDAYDLPNSSAYIGYTNLKDDAVFFFIGHGTNWSGDRGGGAIFYNGTQSVIVAEDRGYSPTVDHYFLSSMSTELNDLLLVVWASCDTAKTSYHFGNLVDMTYQKGADNVIGFSSTVEFPHIKYWSDRFWYRCLYGSFGGTQPQSFYYASNSAKTDVLFNLGSYGGINSMYGRYRFPFDYLNPARYGAV